MFDPLPIFITGAISGFTVGWMSRHLLRPRRAKLVARSPRDVQAIAVDGPFRGMVLQVEFKSFAHFGGPTNRNPGSGMVH